MDTKLAREFTKTCTDGWLQGWHERNGGNLSCRMTENEVDEIMNLLSFDGEWKDIDACVPGLAGEYFMVTGSGKYFRNVELDFEDNVCILRVDETGTRYQIVYGLVNGGRPTSELPSHLMNLEVLKQRDEQMRVVYHAHPANINALTFVLPLDDVTFTRELWEMIPECPLVLPQGIGIVPWMIPGKHEIGEKTSEIMKTRNVAVWAHHGMFVCGRDFDEAFGLMHTVEKSAEILVKVLSMAGRKNNTVTAENLRSLEKPFNIKLDEKYLYEKK